MGRLSLLRSLEVTRMSLVEDNFPAGDKILADIDNVFKSDPDLEEFFIIPVSENQNKSPVCHVNHTLGLESWCIQHMYCHIYRRLMDHKTRRKREDPKIVIRLLRGALLINPETSTFWNMCKQLVETERISPEQDLKFSAIVLSFKPKCSEVYIHRKWVLRKYLQQPDLQPGTVLKLLQTELKVTLAAASKYPSNYNAWNHRKWAMEFIVPKCHEKEVLQQEWRQSHWWTASHVSDFSGQQYRQYLLQRMFAVFDQEEHFEWSDWSLGFLSQVNHQCCAACALSAVLEQELQSSNELITGFEGHEALWQHRRFILFTLKNIFNSSRCPKLDSSLFAIIIGSERLFLKASHESSNPHQIRYALRHESWLQTVLQVA